MPFASCSLLSGPCFLLLAPCYQLPDSCSLLLAPFSLLLDSCSLLYVISSLSVHYRSIVKVMGRILLCTHDGDTTEVLPRIYVGHPFCTFNQVIDRSSINSGFVHFLQSRPVLVTFTFGYFHGLYNSLKRAAKACQFGKIWAAILQLTNVYNLNQKPFRSKAWFRLKQHVLARMKTMYDSDWQRFQDCKHEISKSMGIPLIAPQDDEILWDALDRMKSFNLAGPILKLARWCSIHDVHEWYRPEIPGYRLVMETLNEGDAAMAAEQYNESQESVYKTKEEVQAAMRKSGGILQKAPHYLRPENIELVDIFCLATRTLKDEYKHRSSRVKSIADGLKTNIDMAAGGWEDQLLDCFSCWSDLAALMAIGIADDGPRAQDLANTLGIFTMHIVKERADTLMPEFEGHPGCSVQSLHPSEEDATCARTLLNEDWQLLLENERLAVDNDDIKALLKPIPWRLNSLVRLTFAMNELACDGVDGAKDATTRLLESQHFKFPDEKGVEDINQHVRDESRRRRYPRVSRQRILRATASSGVLKARKMRHVTVGSEHVKRLRPRDLNKPTSHHFTKAPYMPQELNDILLPVKAWPSPTHFGYCAANSHWAWIKAFARQGFQEAGVPVQGAWASRLCKEGNLLECMLDGEHSLILCSHPFGAVCLHLERLSPTEWLPDRSQGSIDWQFVTRLTDFRTKSCKTAFRSPHGVVITSSDDGDNLLSHALSMGMRLKEDDVVLCLRSLDLGIEPEEAGNRPALLSKLIRKVFEGSTDDVIDKLVEQCVNAAVLSDPLATDPDMEDVIEEICLHDSDNVGEVGDLRKAVRNRRVKNMVALRRLQREKAARAKAKAKGKGKRRAKAKAKPVATLVAAHDPLPMPPLPVVVPDALSEPLPDAPPPPAAPEVGPVPPPDSDLPAHPASSSAGPIDDAPRRPPSLIHGTMYSTPDLVASLCPPGTSCALDVPGVRWRLVSTGYLPSYSVSFGPRSGISRRVALETALDMLWGSVGLDRPDWAYVAALAPEEWGDCFDHDGPEIPRKYARAS